METTNKQAQSTDTVRLSLAILPNFGFFQPFLDACLFLAQGASSLRPTLSQQLTATTSWSQETRTEWVSGLEKPHLFSDWRIQEGMCGGDKERRKTYGELSLLYQVIGSVQIQSDGITYTLKCRWLKKTKAFEIVAEPPGKAFLGVNNMQFKRANPEQETVDIKRHIRHMHTYR